jgi:hypothetical protein
MWRMVLLHFIVSVNGLNQQRNMAGFARFFRRSEKITPLSSVLKVICIQVISIRYNQIILHMWGTTVHIINTTHVRYYIYTVDLHYKILYNTIYIYTLLILHIYKLYKYNRWFVNDFPWTHLFSLGHQQAVGPAHLWGGESLGWFILGFQSQKMEWTHQLLDFYRFFMAKKCGYEMIQILVGWNN